MHRPRNPRQKKRLTRLMISWLLYPLIRSVSAFQNPCKVLTASDHTSQARDHLARQDLRN